MPDDSPLPLPATAVAPRTRRTIVLWAALLGMFMAAVESTIVSTAMPTIVAALGGFDAFSWVFAVYLLTQAVTIPIYGRLADLYGRKRVMIAGSAIFLASSLACGFARSMAALILFRAVQGLGAGALVPLATTIIGDIYPPEERGRASGYVSSVWGAAAIIGPLLGAILVQRLSWPTVFWVNLPVGIAAIALLEWGLHEERPAKPHSIDYAGSLLLMGGAGALLLALVQANRLGRGPVAALVAAAVAALALLLWHERRAKEPMMPLDLWRERVIAAVNVEALVCGVVMMAVVGFVPTYVQGVMGASPLIAGFALTAMSFGWPLGSTLIGRVMVRFSYRALAALAAAGLLAGTSLLVLLEPGRGALWAGSGALLIGIGLGIANTMFVVAAQGSVAWNRRGIATSLGVFMRIMGAALGAALFGGILNTGLAHRLPGAEGVVERLMEPAERARLAPDALAAAAQAVAGSLHVAYLVAAALALLALVLALALPAGIGARHARE